MKKINEQYAKVLLQANEKLEKFVTRETGDKKYEAAHKEAGKKFLASPSKCYQRYIREVWGQVEDREQLPSLKGAVVKSVTNEVASEIILKYEWLKKMGAGTEWCYGLFLNEELLGVACFSKGGGSPESRRVTVIEGGHDIVWDDSDLAKTASLCRGACVPHAPKDAGSFLVRHACKLMYKEHGFEIFFAYSDPDAGEVGTIYQAVGWKYLGVGLGRKPARTLPGVKPEWGGFYHTDFVKGKHRIKTHSVSQSALKLGWTPDLGVSKRQFLRDLKFKDVHTPDKHKWIWFEGPRREQLELRCVWKFLPYPKRGK